MCESHSLHIVNVIAGSYTVAPKQWLYKDQLVDKWGFLAKTLLILDRLKGTYVYHLRKQQ